MKMKYRDQRIRRIRETSSESLANQLFRKFCGHSPDVVYAVYDRLSGSFLDFFQHTKHATHFAEFLRNNGYKYLVVVPYYK